MRALPAGLALLFGNAGKSMSDDTARTDEEKEGARDEGAAGSPEKKKSMRKPLLLGLGALVVVAGLCYGAYWYLDARFYVSTADAYVQGNVVMLMPQISGTVTAIRTEETHLVREGEPLVGSIHRQAPGPRPGRG